MSGSKSENISSCLTGASVLITGATGSFGRACVKYLIEHVKPRRLVVFSRDELKQFEMQQQFDYPGMRYFLGDIRDQPRISRALEGVDYVIHAAAVKQVPALEYNPEEAIKTNILGSKNVINAALDAGVKKVVALSTDKAALPINLYGATKLVADKLFISANNIKGTRSTQFSVVRYGNVLGSRGSVVPFFRSLLKKGEKELPITDENMTRFSLTIEEGVEFVLKSFERMYGGELFVPKIPSLKITDVARALDPNIELNFVGVRPGEKLHEVLVPADVSHRTVEFKDFYTIKPSMSFQEVSDYSTSVLGEKGADVEPGFEYRSDNNPNFLSIEELKSLFEHV